MEEIDASEGTRGDGVDGMASTFQLDLSVAANVGKDIALAHFNERKLDVVAVGEEVYYSVRNAVVSV